MVFEFHVLTSVGYILYRYKMVDSSFNCISYARDVYTMISIGLIT